MTSAAIRTVRENFPNAHITLVVRKAVYPLAELCPYVNEVIGFDVNVFNGNFVLSDGILGLLNDLKDFSKKFFWKKHFRLGISFTFAATPLNSLMLYMSGAKERLAYTKDGFDNYLNTRRLTIPPTLQHESLKNLYLLESIGLKSSRSDLEVWYNKEDLLKARLLLGNFAGNRVKIAVGIGANHKERRYPIEKYLVAFKEIINKGAALVILGGPSEVDDAKFLEDNLPSEYVKNVVNVDWRVTMAIISQIDVDK